MKTVFIILTVLLVIYIKWVFILLYLPFQWLYSLTLRHSFPRLLKLLLSIPYGALDKITKGGWERYVIIQAGMIPSVTIRKAIYSLMGVRMGKKVVFHYRTEIRKPGRLTVGEGTIIGDNAILDARRGLVIGRNVNLSSNVSIYTLQHNLRDPNFGCDSDGRKMSIEIDDRAWLGSNVTVLPGIHIGEGAVCCAGCVVTKDVEPYTVVAGIPAGKVNDRPRNLEYQFDGKSCWFY